MRDRAGPTRWTDLRLSAKYWWQTVWTAFLGMLIGIVPGAGATIASFVAYQQSRMFSKTPQLYGTGFPPGVLAPESANNGVTSGTLVPLMAIGVPGGATSAVMMVVLQYQGIVLGPRLFLDTPELAYGVFFYMTMSYAVMLLTILPLARYMSKVVFMPTRIIVPLIITLTIIGAFANRDYLFDMGLALVFAVLGYIAVKTNYHVIAILIGILLGPLFEQYLLRSLRLGQGDLTILFSSTIGNVLWVMVVLSLLPALAALRARRSARWRRPATRFRAAVGRTSGEHAAARAQRAPARPSGPAGRRPGGGPGRPRLHRPHEAAARHDDRRHQGSDEA